MRRKCHPKFTFHVGPSLPTFEQRAENATPAVRIKNCPMSCAYHAKQRFGLRNVPKVLGLPRKMEMAQRTSGAR